MQQIALDQRRLILEQLAQQFAWELADESFDKDPDCNEIQLAVGDSCEIIVRRHCE